MKTDGRGRSSGRCVKRASAFLLALLCALARAQSTDTLPRFDPAVSGRDFTVVKRYDLRKSVNGKYSGLVYGYSISRWQVDPADAKGNRPARVTMYRMADSIRDQSKTEKTLNDEITSKFTLRPDGMVFGASDPRLPAERAWPPAVPADARADDSWEAAFDFALDPRGTGNWTRVPVLAQCWYKGETSYLGQPVIEVKAKYAIRYRKDRSWSTDLKDDPDLQNIEGGREAQIYLDSLTRLPVFIRERVSAETATYADGSSVKNDGFILTFYDGGIPVSGPDDRKRHLEQEGVQIAKILRGDTPDGTTAPKAPITLTAQTADSGGMNAGTDKLNPGDLVGKLEDYSGPGGDLGNPGEGKNPAGISLREDPRGLALTIENLQFVADSATLLPGEDKRLDRIAAALKSLPAKVTFLVIGHTALVGSEASMKALSLERAQTISKALVTRGIDAGRMVCDGRGGREPVADNKTEAGKATNRRVEIILVE